MKNILMPLLLFFGLFLCVCSYMIFKTESNSTLKAEAVEIAEDSIEETVDNPDSVEKHNDKKNYADQNNSVSDNSDFSVITVGTGTPEYNSNKASASTMINYKGQLIVVDCGEGSYANLMESDYNLKNMYGLLFTHMHLDHTADFMSFVISSLLNVKSHLDIVGPPTTSNMYEFIKSTFSDDIEYRLSNIKNNTGKSNKADVLETGVTVTEIEGSNKFTLGDLLITTAEMTHSAYTLAYRFEVDGKSIVVSGDTDYDEDLITLAKDCDILVIDGSSVLFSNSTSQKDESIQQPHMSFDDLLAIATKANPKKLVITHYKKLSDIKTEECKNKIQDQYNGEVIFAQDMMEIY